MRFRLGSHRFPFRMNTLSSHHYVFEPSTNARVAPLLVLHGTGGSEHDLLPLARAVSPGAALLSPRGNVSEHGAARFFARFGEGVFDPVEFTRRTQDLAAFVHSAAAQHGIDLARLTAFGFSNGANIAALLLQLQPATLGAAVLLRPMVVLDQPAAPGSLAGKRVLIASGSEDPIVPADHPERLAELLRAGGATVDVHVSSAGHGLVPQDIASVREWLA